MVYKVVPIEDCQFEIPKASGEGTLRVSIPFPGCFTPPVLRKVTASYKRHVEKAREKSDAGETFDLQSELLHSLLVLNSGAEEQAALNQLSNTQLVRMERYWVAEGERLTGGSLSLGESEQSSNSLTEED